MNTDVQTLIAVTCPHCRDKIHLYEDVSDDSIRIVCPVCHQDSQVNLRTMRATKRVGDNETVLKHKLKCPRCGKHFLLYETKNDEIVGDVCHKCGCVFRGNKLYGKTWIAKRQPIND